MRTFSTSLSKEERFGESLQQHICLLEYWTSFSVYFLSCEPQWIESKKLELLELCLNSKSSTFLSNVFSFSSTCFSKTSRGLFLYLQVFGPLSSARSLLSTINTLKSIDLFAFVLLFWNRSIIHGCICLCLDLWLLKWYLLIWADLW